MNIISTIQLLNKAGSVFVSKRNCNNLPLIKAPLERLMPSNFARNLTAEQGSIFTILEENLFYCRLQLVQ